MTQTKHQDTDVAELLARVDAITEATGALATRIEQLSNTPAASSRELRQQLSALIDLIAQANGCVADALTYVQQRLACGALLVVLVVLAGAACGGESTTGDPMIDASTSGDGSGSGSGTRDSGIDAAPVSHAPCPTCCDPIAQTGCGAGEACYQYEGTESGTDTYCATAGTKPQLAACVNDSDCAPGFDCFSFTHNCRKFCVTNADCPSTTPQCALGTKPPEAPYGICL